MGGEWGTHDGNEDKLTIGGASGSYNFMGSFYETMSPIPASLLFSAGALQIGFVEINKANVAVK